MSVNLENDLVSKRKKNSIKDIPLFSIWNNSICSKVSFAVRWKTRYLHRTHPTFISIWNRSKEYIFTKHGNLTCLYFWEFSDIFLGQVFLTTSCKATSALNFFVNHDSLQKPWKNTTHDNWNKTNPKKLLKLTKFIVSEFPKRIRPYIRKRVLQKWQYMVNEKQRKKAK